jgi:hypothetical protein
MAADRQLLGKQPGQIRGSPQGKTKATSHLEQLEIDEVPIELADGANLESLTRLEQLEQYLRRTADSDKTPEMPGKQESGSVNIHHVVTHQKINPYQGRCGGGH